MGRFVFIFFFTGKGCFSPIPIQTMGCFSPIPFRSGSFESGSFLSFSNSVRACRPDFRVSRFDPAGAGRFGPV